MLLTWTVKVRCLFFSRLILLSIEEVVGGLSGANSHIEYKGNSLWNKYSYVVPAAVL